MITVPEGAPVGNLGAGVPIQPLRRVFLPGGTAGLGAGFPMLPLRRTFLPPSPPGGGGGAAYIDELGDARKGMRKGWVVVDGNGGAVAVIRGKPKSIASGYNARPMNEGEEFTGLSPFTRNDSPMGDADYSMF